MKLRSYLILTLVAAGIALLISLASGQVGGSRILVIPGFYSDQNGAPAQGVLADSMGQVVKLWNDAAAGQASFSYAVAPPFAISYPTTNCLDLTWESLAAVKASNAGLTGDKTIFYASQDNHCRYGGDAAIGGSTMRVTLVNPSIWAHELGHSLGLAHVYGVDFTGQNGDFAHIGLHEYSDPDDVMGGGMYVDCIDLWHLRWFTPPELARGAPQTVTIRPGARNCQSISRSDGIRYFLEIPSAGASIRLRSNYYGHSWLNPILAGEDYVDAIGGVEFRATSVDTVVISTFVPPTPTPHPFWSPTPVVTYSTEITPTPPAECWSVPNYIRCSPTPTPDVKPPVTITFAPPILLTTTPLEPTAVPTDTPTSTPTWTPAPAPTAPHPPTATPIAVGSSGCNSKKASIPGAEVGLLAVCLAGWRRKFRREQRNR